MIIEKWLPIETKSPNVQEHWGKTCKRKKTQRYWVLYLFSLNKDSILTLPCTITFTRTGPRFLDKEENLPMSLKTVKDAIADQLIKGLAPGRADGDQRLTWIYKQEKGKPGVHIRIESNERI